MPAGTLIGDLADFDRLTRPNNSPTDIRFEPLDPQHREQVAELYCASYPPDVGAASLDEARAEMDASYRGDFGRVVTDASPVAFRGAQAVGSVQVVHRSPWDPDLDCPFIIELFVRPEARGQGIARSLLTRAAGACRQLGETEVALRTSDEGGTSAAAFHLYDLAGMRPHVPRPQGS